MDFTKSLTNTALDTCLICPGMPNKHFGTPTTK